MSGLSSNVAVFVTGFVVTGVGLVLLLRFGGLQRPLPFDEKKGWDQELMRIELDRVAGIAKGLAGAAAAFFTSLIVEALKEKLSVKLTPADLIGCFLGVIGCLVAAAHLQIQARSRVREQRASDLVDEVAVDSFI